MVVGGYPPDLGGVETHVSALAEALTRHEVKVDVLTHARVSTPTHGSCTDETGVVVRRFPLTIPAQHYQISLPLWRFLRAHQRDYDIVHTHSYHSFSATGALGLIRGARAVVTPHYHGTGHTKARAQLHHVYRPLAGRLMGRARQIIAVSEPEKQLLLQHYPRLAERITVVPNAVHLAPLQAAAMLTKPIPDSVLVVGRLESYKRVDRIIRAVAQLPESVRLTVVGAGPERDNLARLALESGAQQRVRLLGRVDDAELSRLLVESHVLASASEHEAFGMSVVDGIAAGAVSVASDIPAHRDLRGVIGRDAPLILAAATDEAFADALAAGLRTRRRAVAEIQVPLWDQVARDTLSVYQGALR